MIVFAIKSEKKKTMQATALPTIKANQSAPLKIRMAFFRSPLETLAEISLETANGRL